MYAIDAVHSYPFPSSGRPPSSVNNTGDDAAGVDDVAFLILFVTLIPPPPFATVCIVSLNWLLFDRFVQDIDGCFLSLFEFCFTCSGSARVACDERCFVARAVHHCSLASAFAVPSLSPFTCPLNVAPFVRNYLPLLSLLQSR